MLSEATSFFLAVEDSVVTHRMLYRPATESSLDSQLLRAGSLRKEAKRESWCLFMSES